MRQGIEKQKETKSSKAAVTVTFDGSNFVLGGHMPFVAQENAAPLLSGALKVISADVSDALPRSKLVSDLPTCGPLPHRRRSLSRTEKFSAERVQARSALVVLATIPNKRSSQAAATAFTTMTEQRRCAAA